MEYVAPAPADKTALEELLKRAKGIDTSAYTAESVEKFRTALDVAKTVMADDTLLADDQQIVDDAVKTLADAIDALENIPVPADKTALEEILKRAEKIDTALYTEKTVKAFRTALDEAKTVMADDTLLADDQQTVDNAAKKLSDAIDAMERVPESKPGETDDKNNPKTGDDSAILVWLALAACIPAILVLLIKKKHGAW